MRPASLLARTALVALFAAFALSNLAHWRGSGRPSGLGVTVLEAWMAFLFLVRRPSDDVSGRALAWLAAPAGTFAMLLCRPTAAGFPAVACEVVQLVGLALALASLSTLGRSFGLVAANRGLKLGGPYRLVRHPTYLGYLVCYLGYVLENPSPWNVAVFAAGTTFQLVRIGEEERLLTGDEQYVRYRTRVRYRLVPLVW